MQKVWNVKKYDEEYVKKIMNDFNVSEILAKLLISRNIMYDDIDNFLHGDLEFLREPYLMKDMDKFVERVDKAITNKEKICIYGDYDVDGITSITIMYKFLTAIGGIVDYYLPDRLLEGYGMNNTALDYIKASGAKLVITVDCGITAIEEVEYAKSLGIDVCITDHHECSKILPDAIAVINPKQKDDTYPFKMHAGVGVAFKCIVALSKKYNLDKESYLKYLDIVAIGTISDIVPLVDENRIIAKCGLKLMKNTKNVGLNALLKIVNYKEIDSTMVSFGMAPRINACGRMGNAKIAVNLLLEEDTRRATIIARKLNELNLERQFVEKKIFDEAMEMIQKNHIDKKNSIVLYSKNWHNGVIGIVASRLVNLYFKPVILLTRENEIVRGSGRCQAGFSLYDALNDCKETLVQFGGHELAAGLSIYEENIPEFIELFEEVVARKNTRPCEQVLDIDMQIKRENLSVSLLRDIAMLKPFGQSNNVPLFIYKGLKVVAIRNIKEDKHLKLTLQDNKSLIEGVAFSQGYRRDEIAIGSKIDVVGNIEVNTFNTPKTIQIIIQDFKRVVD